MTCLIKLNGDLKKKKYIIYTTNNSHDDIQVNTFAKCYNFFCLQALFHTGVVVKQHIINAKAMSHTQLLGSIDLDTRQWVDGVLSTTAQAVYSQPPGTTNNISSS